MVTAPAGLAESARRYAAAINACRPDGPCEVLGYSLGGLVALETARQLALAGREVALVGILDTAPPTVPVAPENTSVALSLISRGLGLEPPFDPETVGLAGQLGKLVLHRVDTDQMSGRRGRGMPLHRSKLVDQPTDFGLTLRDLLLAASKLRLLLGQCGAQPNLRTYDV